MTMELTLRVTDLEKKAIAFCREKDVPFPIANYLVDFATEVTKELQEENAELKEKWLQATDEGTSWAHRKSLERENAELKLKLEALEGQTPWKDIKDKSEVIGKLTKAKEIIRELLTCARNYPESNKQKMQKAEQFLRETDIDNAIRQTNESLDFDKIADEMEQDLKDSEVEK